MGKFNSIEEINVWKEGVELSIFLYSLIKNSKELNKDFGLRDQIQRSAVSIPSNIAEGYERESNQEFIRFLYIAKGSCGELRTQIYIASRVGYIKGNDFIDIKNKCIKISKMIAVLIKSLRKYTKPLNP